MLIYWKVKFSQNTLTVCELLLVFESYGLSRGCVNTFYKQSDLCFFTWRTIKLKTYVYRRRDPSHIKTKISETWWCRRALLTRTISNPPEHYTHNHPQYASTAHNII